MKAYKLMVDDGEKYITKEIFIDKDRAYAALGKLNLKDIIEGPNYDSIFIEEIYINEQKPNPNLYTFRAYYTHLDEAENISSDTKSVLITHTEPSIRLIHQEQDKSGKPLPLYTILVSEPEELEAIVEKIFENN